MNGGNGLAFVDLDGFVKSQVLNLSIAVAVGVCVGLFEEVPIDLVPDALIFGLAAAMVVQEVLPLLLPIAPLRGVAVVEEEEVRATPNRNLGGYPAPRFM